MASVLLEARPYRPFKSSEEYLEAMKEDLAEWLGIMYPELLINAENFMDRLDTGVALCKHANNVRQAAEDYLARRQARNKSMTRSMTSGIAGPILAMGNVHYLPAAKSGTFFSRDNVSNFITWCRKSLKIFECLLFETDDLIMRKNEKHVILCLLEVARRGAKFGMLAPMLVQMERQIDREIAADNKANGIGCGTQTDLNTNNQTIATETDMFETDTEDEDEDPVLFYGPQPQIITNDLKSLDEMVRDLVEKCTCPSQFPMVRVSDGKYRIGDTKVLIFVRILRSHVMVRVGGGWDTLSHYLDKHDPCRCKTAHRSSVAARLIPRTNNQNNGIELHKAQVIYERSPPTARKVIASPPHNNILFGNSNRSRSPTPQKKNSVQMSENINAPVHSSTLTNDAQRRPMSPSPRYLIDIKKKQSIDSDNKKINTDTTNHVQFEENFSKLEITTSLSNGSITTSGNGAISINNTTTESLSKFENISDNGSEISDEGYRSLGVIQTIAQKRESLNSQTSADEIDNNARLDQTASSDSQLSPTAPSDDNKTPDNVDSSIKSSDLLETTVSSSSSPKYNTTNSFTDQFKSSPTEDLESNKFEQSGVFITEDEITVDIASTTGLRKTGFSNRIYGNDDFTSLPITINSGNESSRKNIATNNVTSKIPRSPIAIRRRRSVDNSIDSGETAQMGSQNFNRKQPIYRSVRTPANAITKLPMATTTNKKLTKDVTNTWNSLRSNLSNKKRPSITSDTFISQAQSTFDRNTKQRASTTRILYDNNGRRIKGNSNSLTTSPVKSQNSGNSSPLAQQLLDAANSSKNDAQILEKMKLLLSKYSKTNARGKDEFDDFTSAWVHSNGNLERSASTSCSASPSKGLLNKNLGGGSSAASSNESTHSRDMSVICAPRTSSHRGLSKIPAPVRHNTELY